MGQRTALFALAVLTAMGADAPAFAQDVAAPCRLCASGNTDSERKPAAPVSLAVETILNFDRLVMGGNGSGSAEIRPDGSQSVTGSVSALSARSMVGQVVIRGEPGRLVRVELPRSVELYGLSGGTIRLESIESDLPSMPRLDSQGRLAFRFGGIVKVSRDLDGDFRGDVSIDVDYF